MFRVLLADDHPIVRFATRNIIESLGLQLCGDASDGEEALALALAEQPDVAVLDVTMQGLNGIAITRQLHEERPAVKVLLHSVCEDESSVMSALSAGARGYVVKSAPAADLRRALLAVGGNRTYFSPIISEMMLDHATSGRRRNRFTARELQIAQLVAEGLGNKEIARRLQLSIKTVESHRSALMQKSNCHTSAEMVRFAIKQGLIQA
jgi:DNA-binding NarL/FixJ family response regulator